MAEKLAVTNEQLKEFKKEHMETVVGEVKVG